MTVKINYSSDIGGAKKLPSGSEFQIPSRKKRNEIFKDYFQKYKDSGNKDEFKDYLDKESILKKKQFENLYNQNKVGCNDIFTEFNEKNYQERKEFLKNEYDNLKDEDKKKCLLFDKNNVDPISKKSEQICNELKMKDYQDFIKYYPKLCPDSEELKKKLTYMEICDNIAKQFIIDNNNQNLVNGNEKLNFYLSNAFKNIDKTYEANVEFEYLDEKLEEKKTEIIDFIKEQLTKEFKSENYDVEVSLS